MRNFLLGVIGVVMFGQFATAQDSAKLPEAKPVPAVQAVPLPYDQVSFVQNGRELTRYHYGFSLRRPFWYPLIGPSGVSHTRMGHPHATVSHTHHNSVWISHQGVNGFHFWPDRGEKLGTIQHEALEVLHDGDESAWTYSTNRWLDPEGKPVMIQRQRVEVVPLGGGEWLMIIDLRLEAPPGKEPTTIAQNPFGMIGVRMAKTIGVNDGGGRILNSEGALNEPQVFRKPARWVDYSGRVTADVTGGIALLDHPVNPNHPAPFHVRNDGWMGVCLTLDAPIVIEPGKPLRLRYGLWVHEGVPNLAEVEPIWRRFAQMALADMTPPKRR